MGRNYKTEREWQLSKYDEIRAKINKELGSELRLKLKNENKSIATWISENANKYVNKEENKMKKLNVVNYNTTSTIFIDDEEGINEGSFIINFDGITFSNKKEFDEYCKECIINKIYDEKDKFDSENIDDIIFSLYIAHQNKITD